MIVQLASSRADGVETESSMAVVRARDACMDAENASKFIVPAAAGRWPTGSFSCSPEAQQPAKKPFQYV